MPLIILLKLPGEALGDGHRQTYSEDFLSNSQIMRMLGLLLMLSRLG